MYTNVTFYLFQRIAQPEILRKKLELEFKDMELLGTIILAHEGVNLSLCSLVDVDVFKKKLIEIIVRNFDIKVEDVYLKTSFSEKSSFSRFKIKVKTEICTIGLKDLDVEKWTGSHMSSNDFHHILDQKRALGDDYKDYIILDNRNNFEYKVGSYEGAEPVNTEAFSEFPEKIIEFKEKYHKDQKFVMFCTGGIRCEKASAIMRKEGFSNVAQLDGGILADFERMKGKNFQGNCFVFDDRWEVNGQLDVCNNDDVPPDLLD